MKVSFPRQQILNYLSFTKIFALRLWPWYLCGVLFLALTNLITVKIPRLAGTITDNFSSSTSRELEQWAITIIGLGLLQIICRTLSRVLIFWPGRQIEAHSKTSIFSHTILLPETIIDKFGIGDLISRLANDLSQLRVFFAFATLQVFNLIFLMTFTINQMWAISPHLTAVCLAPLSAMILLTRIFIPKLQAFNKQNQVALGSLTNYITETFTNVHLVKSNGAEPSFAQRCDKHIEDVYQANVRVIILRTILFPLISTLATLSQVLVLFYGGHLIIEGNLKVGDLLAFNIYIGTLAFPLTSIGLVLSIYQRGKTALERLNEITSEVTEEQSDSESPRASKILIEIKNLTFQYPQSKNRKPALKNLTMTVREGETIGIIGPVGAGKTTILNLIFRLYDPPKQTVFLSGQDITEIPSAQIRSLMNYALQSPHLFSSSIRDNLNFGLKKKIPTPLMEEAAKKAVIIEDIMGFPEKWETPVGEKGIRLSGGQKQRLALARLFTRDSNIWLLDDVMSAVDTKTEETMIEKIFTTKKTLIVSSHRPNFLKKCKTIFYLNEGELIDSGDYDSLLKRHQNLKEFMHDASQSPK